MTQEATLPAVRHSVTVPLSRERAFTLFVEEFDSWWPKDTHHTGDRPAAQVFIEARPGGRWFERDDEGGEEDWGRVLSVERPALILLAWQLSPRFRFDPDPSHQTEVEVSFEAEDEGRTRVTLEHRGFEVHGKDGAGMRESVDGGWPELLGAFATWASS
jgi:uncharacterized protein YndB with AHSA1/START domain